jgi:hypothetical protein
MGHHIAGMSNSAKRRAAAADTKQEQEHEVACESTGILPSIGRMGTEAWHAVQSGVGDLCCMSKEKAMEVEHAVEEKIQHRPIVSVLAALGLGAIIGSLCTMACKRK